MNGDEISQEAGEINQGAGSKAQPGGKRCVESAFQHEDRAIQANSQQKSGEREGLYKSDCCEKATRARSAEKKPGQIVSSHKNHSQFACCVALPYGSQTVAKASEMRLPLDS